MIDSLIANGSIILGLILLFSFLCGDRFLNPKKEQYPDPSGLRNAAHEAAPCKEAKPSKKKSK